jgi:polyhydroxyalkanoate synthesis regulator phasin
MSMAASKSSSRRSGGSGGAKARGGQAPSPRSSGPSGQSAPGVAEQLVNRLLGPLDAVLLTRERIQETLEDAAERGRITRSDANELAAELLRRGRQQTGDLLSDVERLLGAGREQIDSARRRARRSEPVDRIVRGADRARRTVGAGSSFPISGYDDLTAAQVKERLSSLTAGDLRKVREYELRHGNRKSVLEAVDRALD